MTTEEILRAKYLPVIEADADPEYVEWQEGKRKLDALIEQRKQQAIEKSVAHPTSKLLEFK